MEEWLGECIIVLNVMGGMECRGGEGNLFGIVSIGFFFSFVLLDLVYDYVDEWMYLCVCYDIMK